MWITVVTGGKKSSVVTFQNHHLFEGVPKTKHILLPIAHIYEISYFHIYEKHGNSNAQDTYF